MANAHTHPCPCGSGIAIINCCVSKRANTVPPGSQTGMSNPNCYARALKDCDTKISAEHYISESVLELVIGNADATLYTLSTASTPPPPRSARPAELFAKVLCERHNRALSSLDRFGKSFFDNVLADTVKGEVRMINGNDLERWMLKVLCGYLASGAGPYVRRAWEPPQSWLDVLFGSAIVPSGSGLSILRGRDLSDVSRAVGLQVVESDEPGKCNGLYFALNGFQFYFFMGPPRRDIPSRIAQSGWQMKYRPECIVVVTNGVQREVHFGGPPWGGYAVFVRSDPK